MTLGDSLIRPFLPKWLAVSLQGRVARRLAVLAGGTFAAQGLTLATAPLLTRLYSPEDFGHLAVFAALFSTASTFVSLKYEQAIPAAEDDATAANLFALTAVVAFVQCCGAAVLALLVAVFVPAEWLPAAIRTYFWLLVPGLFCGAIYATTTYWMIREGGFSLVARTKVEQSFAKVGLELVLGLLAVKPLGLLLGHVVGQVGGAGLILRRLWATKRHVFADVSIAQMRQAARKFGNFPIYVMPSMALNALSGAVPLLVLPVMFGPAQAGLFLVAQRLTMWPMTLVGQSVSQVFYGEITEHRHDHRRNLRLFFKLTSRLALLGIAAALVLLSAPAWTGAALSERWKDAGWVMAALAPLLLTRLLASPLSHAHHLQNSQRLFLIIETARLILTVDALALCYLGGIPYQTTVVVYSLSISLIYVAHWLAIFWILSQRRDPPTSLDVLATA